MEVYVIMQKCGKNMHKQDIKTLDTKINIPVHMLDTFYSKGPKNTKKLYRSVEGHLTKSVLGHAQGVES